MQSPFLSVVVSSRQSAAVLARSLEALRASDLPRECWELIVVDDASTDDSAAIASAHADVVVRLPGERRGTAYALNRGFDVARGELVAFLSADVCVVPTTLRRLVAALASEPDVVAVCGMFDCDAAAPAGLAASYANLYESYVRQRSAGETDVLWPACSAVRASAFAQAGMFDEWCVGRPRTAAAEMGRRLRAVGGRILLRTDVCVRPISEPSVGRLLLSILRDDGTPSTAAADMPARGEGARRAGHLRRAEWWSAALMAGAVALGVLAIALRVPGEVVAALGLLALVDVVNGNFYAHVARRRGVRHALMLAPLHTLRMLCAGCALVGGWLYRHVLGERRPKPTIQAFAEVGLTTWPPVPARRRSVPAAPAAAAGR